MIYEDINNLITRLGSKSTDADVMRLCAYTAILAGACQRDNVLTQSDINDAVIASELAARLGSISANFDSVRRKYGL